MKSILAIAALAACAHASLFVQQADTSALWRYVQGGNGPTNPGPLGTALFTDSVVLGSTTTAYPVYGLRYFNGQTRRFQPTGNWLLVTDPISNNYGDFNAPIFDVLTANEGVGNNFGIFSVQIPRNPFSTFHAVVIAAGPASQWTVPGDIVIFQPNPITNNTLTAYNPLDLFGNNLGTGSNSLQNANLPTATPPAVPVFNALIPNVNGWVCLGWNVITLNLGADQQQFFDILDEPYRARNAYCLVPENMVVAKVDLNPAKSYPWPQRTLVSRMSALSSEVSEFGFVGLA